MKSTHRIKVIKLSGGKFSTSEVSVIIEKEFPIFVNGTRLATASLVPDMEKEFIAGYLFGQGFIGSIKDIASLEIEAGGAQVTLKNKNISLTKADYRIVSGGGRSAYFKEPEARKINSELTIEKQTIFRAMNHLFENAPIYKETEGAHAAGLFDGDGKPVVIVEDIGRHNTLDKVIGYTLFNKTDTTKVFLASTGRMASEMVTKICRAGIPIAASKTAVTDRGLEIARKCGLTLTGFVRDAGTKMNTDMDVRVVKEAGMKIYCGQDRIKCQASHF